MLIRNLQIRNQKFPVYRDFGDSKIAKSQNRKMCKSEISKSEIRNSQSIGISRFKKPKSKNLKISKSKMSIYVNQKSLNQKSEIPSLSGFRGFKNRKISKSQNLKIVQHCLSDKL